MGELATLPRAEADGTRPVNWMWNDAHDQVAVSGGVIRSDPLFALAEDMCNGKAPGLRLVPTPGAAVLLETAKPSRKGKPPVADWRLWHAGCSPLGGHGRRWTLQLYFDEPVIAKAAVLPAAGNSPCDTEQGDSCSNPTSSAPSQK